MTQLPSGAAVLAPFDGQTLESGGVSCTVHREGEVFFVDMPDPDWEASEYPTGVEKGQVTGAPRVRLPVVMTTGSHHLQAYWVPSEHGNKVRIFPYVYHIGLSRWIPNDDSFITPPDGKRYPQVWNNNCIKCHSVAGDVGYERGNWQTSVAELGISCEACHGPGAAHVAHHQNPVARYSQHFSGTSDPTIVNPAKLPPDKASQVCGQCHTAFNSAGSETMDKFRPGADFSRCFQMADDRVDQSFWPDGTMRIGGREYSGLSKSACYLKGGLSCLSCHSMHSSDPNKQMRAEMLGDDACTSCHATQAKDIAKHTHHAADSVGSRCYNCHMPYSSYALFNAVRSHRIDSPIVSMSANNGRPNACNQCHVDQTLKWTGEHLQQWYDIAPVALSEEESSVPDAILRLLRGDAIQRVLAARSLGWEPAMEASGNDWQVPFLAQLLDDPYSIARYVAHESLTELGCDVGEFDFVMAPEKRGLLASQIQDTFKLKRNLRTDELKQFFSADQRLNGMLLQSILSRRDDRPITLNE